MFHDTYVLNTVGSRAVTLVSRLITVVRIFTMSIALDYVVILDHLYNISAMTRLHGYNRTVVTRSFVVIIL